MSHSLRPHGLYPTRLLWPWDFPGKSTGVGCHFLLHQEIPEDHLPWDNGSLTWANSLLGKPQPTSQDPCYVHQSLATLFPHLDSIHHVFSLVWLCDPMDCSPPGPSVHRIFQARILKRVTISSFRVRDLYLERYIINTWAQAPETLQSPPLKPSFCNSAWPLYSSAHYLQFQLP